MLMKHDWVSAGSEPEKVSAAIDILGKAFSDTGTREASVPWFRDLR